MKIRYEIPPIRVHCSCEFSTSSLSSIINKPRWKRLPGVLGLTGDRYEALEASHEASHDLVQGPPHFALNGTSRMRNLAAPLNEVHLTAS